MLVVVVFPAGDPIPAGATADAPGADHDVGSECTAHCVAGGVGGSMGQGCGALRIPLGGGVDCVYGSDAGFFAGDAPSPMDATR